MQITVSQAGGASFGSPLERGCWRSETARQVSELAEEACRSLFIKGVVRPLGRANATPASTA